MVHGKLRAAEYCSARLKTHAERIQGSPGSFYVGLKTIRTRRGVGTNGGQEGVGRILVKIDRPLDPLQLRWREG